MAENLRKCIFFYGSSDGGRLLAKIATFLQALLLILQILFIVDVFSQEFGYYLPPSEGPVRSRAPEV